MKEKELLEVLSSFNDVYLSGFGGEVEIEPLDGLYGEIEREYLDYFSKNEKFAEEHDGNVFMCDRFSDGKTKFTEPDELWHVYNNVEFAARKRLRL